MVRLAVTVPSDALPQSDARVLAAVIRLDAINGRATVRDAAELAGYQSVAFTHLVLKRLRARGLVTWVDGHKGTLKPTVRPIAV